jgi:hypothetical protein
MDACGNPCDLGACELCIGEDAPPAGCGAPGCNDATACASGCDCAADEYCLTGCCRTQ